MSKPKTEANTEAKTEEMPNVVRTSAGLRDALFDEIDRIRSGETDAKKANAVARLAGEIVNTVTMEITVQKHLASLPKDGKAEPMKLMRNSAEML